MKNERLSLLLEENGKNRVEQDICIQDDNAIFKDKEMGKKEDVSRKCNKINKYSSFAITLLVLRSLDSRCRRLR